MLKPLTGIGFINSGNNPVIFNSMGLAHFIQSGGLKNHLDFVSSELSRKCKLLCAELKKAGEYLVLLSILSADKDVLLCLRKLILLYFVVV